MLIYEVWVKSGLFVAVIIASMSLYKIYRRDL